MAVEVEGRAVVAGAQGAGGRRAPRVLPARLHLPPLSNWITLDRMPPTRPFFLRTLLTRSLPSPPVASRTLQETINKLEETNHALTERLAWLGSKSFTVLVEDDPPAASIPENEEDGSKAAPATIRT